MNELQGAFDDMAGQFIEYCDANKDKLITKDEFVNAIIHDTTDLNDADFAASWLSRLDGVSLTACRAVGMAALCVTSRVYQQLPNSCQRFPIDLITCCMLGTIETKGLMAQRKEFVANDLTRVKQAYEAVHPKLVNTGAGSIIAEHICPVSYGGANGPHPADMAVEYNGGGATH